MIVQCESVTKYFGQYPAVRDLDFAVPEGCVYGFIGPNGSGKTTMLRMILRIIEPDSGSIRVFGKDRSGVANERIAYLPEERGLYRKMTVLRQLTYFGTLKGLRHRDARERARHWLKKFELESWANQKLEALSKGMSQKIQFIATILADPELIILDEPFSGLDPVNLDILRDTVLELRSSGKTILFSTHDMHTAEKMCDRLLMIYRGDKVLDGTLEEIQHRFGEDTIRFRCESPEQFPLNTLPGVVHSRQLGNYWEIQYNDDPQNVLRALMNHGRVTHFELVHPNLHDIFVRTANPAPEEMNDVEGMGGPHA